MANVLVIKNANFSDVAVEKVFLGWTTLNQSGYSMTIIESDPRIATVNKIAPVGTIFRVKPGIENISVGLAASPASDSGKGQSQYWKDGFSGGDVVAIQEARYASMRMVDKSDIRNHYTANEIGDMILVKEPQTNVI